MTENSRVRKGECFEDARWAKSLWDPSLESLEITYCIGHGEGKATENSFKDRHFRRRFHRYSDSQSNFLLRRSFKPLRHSR
jgi:hypothetical protein